MTLTAPLLLVSGYASVDFALQLAPFQGMDATTDVRSRADQWPRYGGVVHVTRAAGQLAQDNVSVAALSWVGNDAEGGAWIQAVADGGADTRGIVRSGDRTPNSFLLYPEGDGTICLFDAGNCQSDELTTEQRELLSKATTVVVTIGPQHSTRQLLECVRPDSTVFWILKQDPASLTGDLAARLAARANFISLSEGEGGYLDGIAQVARPGTKIVVTRGSQGSDLRQVTSYATIETIGSVPASPVSGVDTTGAGDTFSGTLAALIAGSPERDTEVLLDHLRVASAATARLLASRGKDAAN
ncbi:MAG: carbohydrate kinase family protein [Leucobacter sp.]